MPQSKTMTDTYRYLILGGGRQGTAAAFDLGKFGRAERIDIADRDLKVAQASAERVNSLLGKTVAYASALEVTDDESLRAALEKADCALSAVPYYFNLQITKAAIDTRTHLCDMGGYTDIVFQQLRLDTEAKNAGISILPDCGMGPGLINTMGALAIELLDEPEEIYIYDAGLPQKPMPPWNYQLTFHINGLTNEMDGKAVFLRDGEVVKIDTLTEPEWIEMPPFGRLEAEVTSGGTSTAPWSFQHKVKRYENKVLRLAGHYDWLRAYKTLGLFSETPILVGEQTVVPRQVYHTLLEPKISAPKVRDVGIIRAKGVGRKGGKDTTVVIDVIDYYDEATGFTAMERLTGWHCSVMMALQTEGAIPSGAQAHEVAAPAARVMAELEKRGIAHTIVFEEG